MQRDQLAIHGTEGREGVPRVEIVLNAHGQPDLLHPADGGGRFARVIRGFVGAGHLPKAVAIKLERDEIDPAAGAVKFISEYQAQVRVHERLKDGEHSRVVRLFEMWKLPAHLSCDELPPTILCPRSRQVLAPKCPVCKEKLRDDRSCEHGCSKGTGEEILAASRCAVCANDGVACPGYWLNSRLCKILLLELLDVDLEQYLNWRWSPPSAPPQNRPAWKKYFHEHLVAIAERDNKLGRDTDVLMAEYDEWQFILGLFIDALDGVREMHACRIAHLDLKPANLCLSLDGATARLKVIDLGQADNPTLPWSVRMHSIYDDADARRASGSIFWAPEQKRSRFLQSNVEWRREGQTIQLRVRSDAVAAQRILEGDVFCFPTTDEQNPFLRVARVDAEVHGYVVVSTAPVAASAPTPTQPENWKPLTEGCFVQTAGACADLFALGLLLVHLVGRGRVEATPLRSRVEELTRWLRARGEQAAALPTRALVQSTFDIGCPDLTETWKRLRANLPAHAPLRELVEELLGTALQAFVRSIPGFSYAQHRADEMASSPSGPTPLERFRADVLTIRNRLVTLAQTHDLHDGRVARFRRAGLNQCLAWLKKQTPAAAVGAPPEYDRTRISCALDLLSVDEARNFREFRFLLRYYHGVIRWMRRDLLLFNKELKARLTMAQMHPVVREMFNIVSPANQMLNGNIPVGLPEALSNPALKARHAILRCKKRMEEYFEFLRATFGPIVDGRAWYVTEFDVARLAECVCQMTNVVLELHQNANRLEAWHDLLQVNQRRKIIGWERLELGGAGGWHEFGQRVLQHMAEKREDATNWHRQIEASAKAANAVADTIRGDLLTPWPTIQSTYQRTLPGLFRRFLAWVRGRPLSVPLREADKLVARWMNAVEAAGARIAKIGPPPFDALLPQDRTTPPQRKAHE